MTAVQYLNLAQTAVVILIYIILRVLLTKIVDRTLIDRVLQESRGRVTKRVIHIVLIILGGIAIFLIWGINKADFVVFIGSVLTIVGVAFFAQWSILSNITSSIIIFFNHPIRLNDEIVILEAKDYVIEGKIINIGLFFISLETKEGEEITLPNNIFIQKSVKKFKSDTENISH